ncbi:50S ribosomal protein L3 N(5)-glutamine methyltransferase [Psychrosphaera sp. B3R10]|uniref:50S ribosomal protein L3 N(5)-glutamine methyltransferase n=1 Tax=unclassified Psychrosphaera TaxID=2641570 RepID=UPI001C097F3A|nr:MULTISPECIES: 50S ribosomal protein L3 N(5)-glutamine methyltransferase [unclassified Psychrosphaera]MBU2881592.1 50S ribosomal protein L3 N(5)-glutamine methyltransferase [Psychrosphaera sp. I2R16]MBU2991153.1 50S ribosomal protein L3 N(5)-glutamine methyltransferase [Psychrosphaera sp. B3R10]MDO6719516.1 50S ribosomal protein L3 N(5)-glutamine methyltransferase [Psychrosphaera sp. 1_MG-2023]
MQKELSELTILLEEAVTELQTVNDLIRWSVSRFNESDIYLGHGTDNPWDEAAQLITYALSLPPTMNEHLLQARTTLSERKNALGLIEQRILTKKPAAYLTQVSYFCGLPFFVNEDVLVPRSPIGELITNNFEGLISNTPLRIMDLCTGSGCIAIATAFAFPDATIDALDISPEALAVADENIHRLQVEDRVFPIMSDVFASVEGLKYDLIVSNPPYVDLEDLGDMPEEFHHEPEIGLGSGNDGLDITRIILKQAAAHLEDNGLLIVEVGNSMIHLQAEFPEVPFNWLEFENGGIGVFAITKQQLIDHKDLF